MVASNSSEQLFLLVIVDTFAKPKMENVYKAYSDIVSMPAIKCNNLENTGGYMYLPVKLIAYHLA